MCETIYLSIYVSVGLVPHAGFKFGEETRTHSHWRTVKVKYFVSNPGTRHSATLKQTAATLTPHHPDPINPLSDLYCHHPWARCLVSAARSRVNAQEERAAGLQPYRLGARARQPDLVRVRVGVRVGIRVRGGARARVRVGARARVRVRV